MRLTRREVLRLGAAAGASASSLSFWTALAATTATDGPWLYDATHLDGPHTTPQQRVAAYDELHLVATLQGIVNRRDPRLLVRLIPEPDDFWLGVLRSPGNLLDGTDLTRLSSVDDLVRTFHASIAGAVIWDPNVPATSNVASTVAGVEELVAIRYDLTPGSLFVRYVLLPSPWQIPAVRWLVHLDGTSLFTGTGSITGTAERSTGSAKCDAYVWARRLYLDSGRCDPTALGYYIDSRFLDLSTDPLSASQLANHDYLVAHRGFVLDLDVWDDEFPVDDPGQSLGTDARTLRGILASASNLAGGDIGTIHGFAPWRWKYSTLTGTGVPGGRHDPPATEQRLVTTATQYNACIDADAPNLGCMVNASVFQHGPLRDRYEQAPVPSVADLQARGLVDAAGRVVPRHYLAFYAGDYDSAAWVYQAMPALWSDPARGTVPVNWAIDPNLEHRAGSILDHLWTTRTGNDVFVSGDSGAGYVNPGLLESPRPLSGLPSGMNAWAQRCERAYARWDLSVTGFVINGAGRELDEAGRRAYAAFSPGGVGIQGIVPSQILRAGVPLVCMTLGTPGTVDGAAERIAAALRPDLDSAPPAPQFLWVRTVLQPPSYHAAVVDRLQRTHPDAGITVVDAHTLFALVRRHLAGSVALWTPGDPRVARGGDRLQVQVCNYTGAPVSGFLSLEAPRGWRTSPKTTPFHLDVETEVGHPVDVIPAAGARHGPEAVARLTAVATWGRHTTRHPFSVTLEAAL